MIFRGNHKSSYSEMNSAVLEKSISKEINQGLVLPITIKYIQNIKNSGVVPLVVAEKVSINEKGERYIKRCVTHAC